MTLSCLQRNDHSSHRPCASRLRHADLGTHAAAFAVVLGVIITAAGVLAQDPAPVSPRRQLDLSRPMVKGWDPVTFNATDVLVNKAIADSVRSGMKCSTDAHGWLDCRIVFRGTLIAIMKDPERSDAQFTIHQKDSAHWMWFTNGRCLHLVVARDRLMPRAHVAANGVIPEQSVLITAAGEVMRTASLDDEERRQQIDFETQRCGD